MFSPGFISAVTLKALAFTLVPVFADLRLFADLRDTDLVPKDVNDCIQTTSNECLAEFHTGRFEGSQQHRSSEQDAAVSSSLKPAHTRLLLLITTIWRNFERRRLLRNALGWCRHTHPVGSEVTWRFLLGDVPQGMLGQAMAEAEMHEDLMFLGGVDEMEYSHVGDGYELEQPNPELVKIVVALRRLHRELSYDYAIIADDDSFVSTPNALELADMLPKERVYVGNMIDTIPQRFDEKRGLVMAEYTVNLYLHTAAKVPVFAHGLGFMISKDVANLIADLGLTMKMRGNDDMLFGVWLRSIEHPYYLHYWPWFHDHEGFEGAFSRPCDTASIVVHRMTPERWRTFSKLECHLCGPPSEPLVSEPGDPVSAAAEKETRTPKSKGSNGLALQGVANVNLQTCVAPEELGCVWMGASRDSALKEGFDECARRCEQDAVLNATRPRPCPASVCFALCQPPGPLNSLCPERLRGRPTRSKVKPLLAICVFGSKWADRDLRRQLRNSLKTCSSKRLGVAPSRAKWLFVMGALPGPGQELRHRAVREVLQHRDMVAIHTVNKSVEAVYAYSEGWRLVEEYYGGAEFLLFLDHRSYVNIPFILHAFIPKLPRTKILQGCLLDESLFGAMCSGQGHTRCDYLWRRRAPLFPHGMGFLMSADVAKFVSDMSLRIPLRQADVPADVAFGMWVQPIEDLEYISVEGQIHELPVNTGEGGILSREGSLDIRQPLSESSAIAWPMTPSLWRAIFHAPSCTLTNFGEESHVNLSVLAAKSSDTITSESSHDGPNLHESAETPNAQSFDLSSTQSTDTADCWAGMGGRPEAWYLVCCEVGWSGCWGGDFTEALCCKRPPNFTVPSALDKQGSLDALQRFLNFDETELKLFLWSLHNVSSATLASSHSGPRFRCLSPADCSKEAFARFYQASWAAGFAPLRHPWMVERDDYLFGVQVKMRMDNDGWGPKGHEHTFERQQLAHFLRRVTDQVRPVDMPPERRCLEWDSGSYSRHYFREHCDYIDVITYMGDGQATMQETADKSKRDYFVDIHIADAAIPANSTGIVVCTQIFEHLRNPPVAMQQLFRVLAPGGYVAWSAPLFSEVHGAPQDYWRFTPSGAQMLAEDAGFTVLDLYAPGSLQETAGYLLGLTAPYWKVDNVLEDGASTWPLQVYMLLQKPAAY